ncbi:queuosine-tRNA galactosyltransferase isoform X2 [Danio rerio]|uniref:Queuosine-tRNA galactosyltransferase isoform X2 n=1 Tax=Danio rerio TaxID=7955 RepID=A0AB32TU41_DANRE
MSGKQELSGGSEPEPKRFCERSGCHGGGEPAEGDSDTVSVIMPVFNASDWLDECLQAILEQDFQGRMELCVFDDGSTDDVMKPQRVRLQQEAAAANPTAIVGCKVCRVPEGSTERYTRWINSLSAEQLLTQVYTSHGPTVIMPSWFCSRSWFEKVGQFHEGGKGVPEDLLFFYQSLRLGGLVLRVDECLLVYRYHEHAATHSVLEQTIWDLRVDFLQERVLSQWDSFTIWNAGKQGRKLYRSLRPDNQSKVKAFCDVDENKIKKGFYTYEESKERPKPKIPVLHFRNASPPFIVCVKLDMTDGVLEGNLHSLQLTEGVHYYHFN